MIAHVVLFNAKDGLSEDRVRQFTSTMQECFRSIDHIDRVVVGRRVSIDAGYHREFGGKTYQYAAVLEFRDKARLVAYLRHPKHEELGRLFWEFCDSTIVTEHEMIDALTGDLEGLVGGKRTTELAP